MKMNPEGKIRPVGTGFSRIQYLTFGPDAALYCSDPDNRRILRIVPTDVAPTITMVSPNPITGSNVRQSVTLNGADFVAKPTVTLSWTKPPLPPAGGYILLPDRVNFVSADKLEISIVTSTIPDTWTVKVTNPDGRSSAPYQFTVQAPGPCETGPSAFGLTIITHGYRSETTSWVQEMADSIAKRMGGNVPIRTLWLIRSGLSDVQVDTSRLPELGSINQRGNGILLIDWSDADEGIPPVPCLRVVPTWKVADRVLTYLLNQQDMLRLPLHLIGHSRGASVMSRLAYDLGAYGVWVEQTTFLDPRPMQGAPCPQGVDFDVSSWENVLFVDNYYRRWSGAPPYGEPVSGGGAYELDLSYVVTGDGYNCATYLRLLNGTAHEQVHTYYHGTILLDSCADGVSIQPEWYEPEYPMRQTGYYFSRTGGGDRYTGEAAKGLHHRLTNSGTPNRTAIRDDDLKGAVWPNATLKPLAEYNVNVGSPVDLTYFCQDADSKMTVEFYLDKDANPFNNEAIVCYRFLDRVKDLPASDQIAGPKKYTWTPRETDVGKWFVQIKASDADGHVRYDYLQRPVTIHATGQPKSDLVIENLAVTPAQAEPGATVTVAFSIRNAGPGVAYESHANLRLNASSTAVAPADRPLALDLDVPELRPGAVHSVTRNVPLPAVDASGTYYIWVIADVRNEANQSDTSDASDKAKTPIGITVPSFGGIGDWVEVYGTGTAGLRVRGPEPCDAPLNGARRFDGMKGLVLDGPRKCNIAGQDYTLWKIQWSDCVLGWSAQEWLRKIATGAAIDCDRELHVLWTPANGGTVSASPAKSVYQYGEVVTLTAQPGEGYYLENWDGADEANGLTAQVTMDADRTVTAQFQRSEADSGCTCPAECAAGSGGVRLAGPGETIDLNLLRRFRDEVLSATPEGRQMIDEFYQNSPEMLHHMAADPTVLTSVQTAIVSLQPTIRDLVDGSGQQVVSESQVQAVNTLAQQLFQPAGVVLRSAIQDELSRVGSLDALAGKTSTEVRRALVGIPLKIAAPRLGPDGTFQFSLEGDLNGTVRAEVSTDLAQWSTVTNFTSSGQTALVQLPAGAGSDRRFYRAVVSP